MRAVTLVARSFRNLADLELEWPPEGAVLLGLNGHGKTSLLEAIYYPVLCRSFRGAPDAELPRWGGPGFRLRLDAATTGGSLTCEAAWHGEGRVRDLRVNGAPVERVVDAIGHWLAVVFQPTDVQLVQGGASGRRQYLDRVLSLADREYLRALTRYRGALAQRNAALRAARADLAEAFTRALAEAGARVVAGRLRWVEAWAERFAAECEALGEPGRVTLGYRGQRELAEPAAWAAALEAVADRERRRGMTLVGPQRDDLVLDLDGRSLRAVGSTGQQRTAALALKLCELAALGVARGTEPALLLDDAFAELDTGRQARLAARLGSAERQVFVTAPRRDELPPAFTLPAFAVERGAVRRDA